MPRLQQTTLGARTRRLGQDHTGSYPPPCLCVWNLKVLTGSARYVFLLYVQPAGFEYSFLDLADRAGFNLSGFAERTGMGDPVAGTYFLTEVV